MNMITLQGFKDAGRSSITGVWKREMTCNTFNLGGNRQITFERHNKEILGIPMSPLTE
jgi:hypothetical protein